MSNIFSVEIDRGNAVALAHTIDKMRKRIPDFEYDWKCVINAGGIDYGIYLNIDVDEKRIEICNQPEYGSDGDDDLEAVFDCLEDEEEEEDDEA